MLVNEMGKKTIGLVIFWIGVIWSFAWGVIGSVICSHYMHRLTAEQLSQSIWSFTGPLMLLWGVCGVPLGAIVAAIGLLLYADAKGLKVLKFALGIVIVFIISMLLILLGA